MAGIVTDDESYVNVTITSSLSSFGSQRRFPSSTTIGELKVMNSILSAPFDRSRVSDCRAS